MFAVLLTATVGLETDGRSGQTINKVPCSTGLHLHTGVPLTAVVVEADTHRQADNALLTMRVAAIQPDGCMGATVVLRDAEGRHGISSHAGESVPFTRHVAVTQRNPRRLVDVEVRVPPRFIQADVGRAGVQG